MRAATAPVANWTRRASPHVAATLRAATPLLLFAAIGAELMALWYWLPETLDHLIHPEAAGYGDFKDFYVAAGTFELNNLYSPGLAILIHPLTYLALDDAYRVYFAVNAAAMIGVALIAQAGVRSPAAKIAVALGVLALPQSHWALRVGHFSEVLAFVALAGFINAKRRPYIAGVFLSLLALKPIYLVVPVLYLVWSRNWRALGVTAGLLGALSLAGMAATASTFSGDLQGYYLDRTLYIARDLLSGQQEILVPVQQSWQYSWTGFLISTGAQPNALVTADLFVVSAALIVIVWVRCAPSVAMAAAALGMLLLAPYSTFYNWGMIAVAGALLLRSDVRPRWLAPAIVAGMGLAAAATQRATPFPSYDVLGPGGTHGIYWLQPAALAALAALAIAGGRQREAQPRASAEPHAPFAARMRAILASRPAPGRLPQVSGFAAVALAATAAGFVVAMRVSENGPFQRDPYFTRAVVLGALPVDFPLPDAARLDGSGRGKLMPYRAEWSTEEPVSEVAAMYRRRLDDGSWEIVNSEDGVGRVRMRTIRRTADDHTDVLAELAVEEAGTGSRVRLEFIPLPVERVRGYHDWLASVHLNVRNVAPESSR